MIAAELSAYYAVLRVGKIHVDNAVKLSCVSTWEVRMNVKHIVRRSNRLSFLLLG